MPDQPTETLTCEGCGHSITTGKTIGKSNLVMVACPKCSQERALSAWRQRTTTPEEHSPSISGPESLKDANPTGAMAKSQPITTPYELFVIWMLGWTSRLGMGGSSLVFLFQFVNQPRNIATILIACMLTFVLSLVLAGFTIIIDRVVRMSTSKL